jgi:hypothetical protein
MVDEIDSRHESVELSKPGLGVVPCVERKGLTEPWPAATWLAAIQQFLILERLLLG